MKKLTAKQMFELLKPKGKLGRPPVMRQCPYCKIEFTATALRPHLGACKTIHMQPPPPPPDPMDLENQVLSSNPLERVRQLDQQEEDRILRTLE